ncbi:DUF262 domain-containing protein [Helicobacter marmotae]|uniref:DUF262 domain-containing protein n=2 Tax=Helicobacter marmotae TaxID=152490 RepID=A0A3D8I3Z3_9HELI|nr:DUF262 domain-containing protein [Helicobacter marmotae]
MTQDVETIFGTRNTFNIPNYQRDYAWKKQNLEDLWEDLLEAKNSNDDMGHFLGTIVVAKKPDSEVYDIIDGQQRATTIFMLRYALNAKTGDYYRNHFFDQNGDLRLKLISQNKEFFKKILNHAEEPKIPDAVEKEAKTEGQKNLCEVFNTILAKTASLSQQEAQNCLNTLHKMAMMLLEEKDSGRAIRTFQSVNDRGVPLSILDKLKALLILYSNKYCQGELELDEKINKRFGEIFRIITAIKEQRVSSSLGDRDFAKEVEKRVFHYHSLGQSAIGHYSYGADKSYDKIKTLLKEKLKTLQESPEQKCQEAENNLRQWLDEYSQDLRDFFCAFLDIAKKAETNEEIFKLFYILKINPYFYSSLVRLEMNKVLDNECLKLFAQAEMLFYGLGSINNGCAYKLYEHTDSKDSFKGKVIDFAIQAYKDKDYEAIKDFIDKLAKNIYQQDKKYFHYIFLTYHSQGIDMSILNSLVPEKVYNATIEHIISQNAFNNGLAKQYGFESQEEFEKFEHDFGNLLVLEQPLNSEAKDKALVAKQDIYKKSNIPYNAIFANKENFATFNKDSIKAENEKLTDWLKTYFKEFL